MIRSQPPERWFSSFTESRWLRAGTQRRRKVKLSINRAPQPEGHYSERMYADHDRSHFRDACERRRDSGTSRSREVATSRYLIPHFLTALLYSFLAQLRYTAQHRILESRIARTQQATNLIYSKSSHGTGGSKGINRETKYPARCHSTMNRARTNGALRRLL